MELGPPRRRRARPVADAPIDGLLLRSEDLTKGWLLALLEQAPLDDAPAILAAGLAREGPGVCAAVLRALVADAELQTIEPGGLLEPVVAQTGEFAGAVGAEATSRAVDTLGAVIWSGLRRALVDPEPDQVSDLAERLALVIEMVRGAALRRLGAARPAARGGVVGSAAVGGAEAGAGASTVPLWMRALEDEIGRCRRSGAPLSLLLAELDDGDLVMAVESGSETAARYGRFTQAIRSVIRRSDVLACETGTRACVIAPDTGRDGAQALGRRIVSAVRAAQPWRGAPMTVSVGLAVLGEDGRDCAGLVEVAEQARFAAAAGGIGIVHNEPPRPASKPPDRPGPRLAG